MQMPIVKFADFARQRKEFIRIDDFTKYTRARVQLHWRGIVERDQLEGAAIKTKDQQVARTGELLVAEIDAKVGGIGIVPAELDGAVVSSHYFLFEIDEKKCLRKWLDYFVRSGALVDQVAARGSTNYAAIRPQHVLSFEMPLPTVAEQRRIVARIEELSAKVEEALQIRFRIESEIESLYRAILIDKSLGAPIPIKMKDLVRLREMDIVVDRTQSYQFAGVNCFGKGVFKSQLKTGSEFSYDRLTQLKANDFVYPKLMAWEGALGIVPDSCDGFFVSPEFPVFEIDHDRVLPETLDVFFRMPSVWEVLGAISKGTNVRRRRLHPARFLEFEMPLPPMAVQRRLQAAKQRLDDQKRVRTETVSELNALMPSILSRAFAGELL